MTQDERNGVFASGGLDFSAEELKAIKVTQREAVRRLLYKWTRQRERMLLALKKQDGYCAISGELAPPDGKLTHLDHKWAMREAAQAVVDGMPIGEAYAKLWAETNLRAVLAGKNYERNKKRKRIVKLSQLRN